MADRKFGGSRYWVLGAVWWFVLGGILALLRQVYPDMSAFSVGVIAVLAAVVGPLLIVYLFRPKS